MTKRYEKCGKIHKQEVFYVVKTILNHPCGNGWTPTYLIMVKLDMVYYCFTHLKGLIVLGIMDLMLFRGRD